MKKDINAELVWSLFTDYEKLSLSEQAKLRHEYLRQLKIIGVPKARAERLLYEPSSYDRALDALERIAGALEMVVDRNRRTVRTVDIDRGKVYRTHLGSKLQRRKR